MDRTQRIETPRPPSAAQSGGGDPGSSPSPPLITFIQAAALAGLHRNSLARLIRRAQANGDPLADVVIDIPGARPKIRRLAFLRWLTSGRRPFPEPDPE